MSRKKIITTVYITPEQREMLKTLSSKTKVPISEYIREGIEFILEKNKEKLPGQITLEEGFKLKTQ